MNKKSRYNTDDGQIFEFNDPLSVESPCFASEIYSMRPADLVESGVNKFEPRVINGPRMSGTTTHSNWIAYLHNQISLQNNKESVKVSWIEPPRGSGKDTALEFSKMIAKVIGGEPQATFKGMIETLPDKPRNKRILVIDAADELDDYLIRWILANVQGLVESRETCFYGKIQVLVVGAFTLETLSGSPNSEYPLPTINIPEFDRNSHEMFIKRRLKNLTNFVYSNTIDLLWDETHGDKFGTQCLSEFAVRNMKSRGGKVLSVKDITKARDSFHKANSNAGRFFGHLKLAVEKISNDPELGSIVAFFKKSASWNELSQKEKRILYKAGLVKRDHRQRVLPRSPLIQEAFEWRMKSRSAVFLFSKEWLGTFREEFAEDIESGMIDSSYLAAAGNDLEWFYYGNGTVIESGLVSVRMESVWGEGFEAEWAMHLPFDISIGSEVVVVSFCIVDAKGITTTQTVARKLKG